MTLLFTLFLLVNRDTESGFPPPGNNTVDTDSLMKAQVVRVPMERVLQTVSILSSLGMDGYVCSRAIMVLL